MGFKPCLSCVIGGETRLSEPPSPYSEDGDSNPTERNLHHRVVERIK